MTYQYNNSPYTLADAQFAKRYAWNDTVHKVHGEICREWHSSQSRLGRHSSQGGRNGTVYKDKVILRVFKSGSFPVADTKGSGTTSHWLEDFWEVHEHDADCGKQRVTRPDYVNPLKKAVNGESGIVIFSQAESKSKH